MREEVLEEWVWALFIRVLTSCETVDGGSRSPSNGQCECPLCTLRFELIHLHGCRNMTTSKKGIQPLYSNSHANWMLSSTLFRWFNRSCTLSLGTTMQVSSTNRFQKGSWMSNVSRAQPSTSSMTRFVTERDTGDPMPVPNTCLYNRTWRRGTWLWDIPPWLLGIGPDK